LVVGPVTTNRKFASGRRPKADDQELGSGEQMTCSQLQYLQQNFAALLAVSDRQEELERLGMILTDDKAAVKAFREELQKRLMAAGARLGAHVQEHGCAN